MKSRVHPRYKTKYHVGNWPSYDRALVQRGDVTFWLSPDAVDAWRPEPSKRAGAPRRFSDLAIETAVAIRLVYGLPFRQTEGFLRSLLTLMDAGLDAPDHTTLSRRSQKLQLSLRRMPADEGIHLIIDSSGLSIVGTGEWAAAKHGGRGKRGWKKLHLGVDQAGLIVAQALTEATADDARTGGDLIRTVPDAIARVTADGAYDTVAFYDEAARRGCLKVVVPPAKVARVSPRRGRSKVRDRVIERIREVGRRTWKKEAGYHQQARVENAFFRYKSIIGEALRARTSGGQMVESLVACQVLNRMTSLGRPESYRIGR